MIRPEKVVTIHPYFRAKKGQLELAKAKLKNFIAKASAEKANLYYDFTLNGDVIFCREGYEGAAGLLVHLENVADELKDFTTVADVLRVEVHGAAAELDLLKGALAGLNPESFVFQCGVAR